MNWYRIKTSFVGIKRLITLSDEDKQDCIDAYKFFQRMQAGEEIFAGLAILAGRL